MVTCPHKISLHLWTKTKGLSHVNLVNKKAGWIAQEVIKFSCILIVEVKTWNLIHKLPKWILRFTENQRVKNDSIIITKYFTYSWWFTPAGKLGSHTTYKNQIAIRSSRNTTINLFTDFLVCVCPWAHTNKTTF